MSRIRIGIDGRAFTSPAPGIRRYVEGLVPALLALEGAPEVVALGGRGAALPVPIRHVAERMHPPTNAGWTLVGLPRAAAEAGVDVLHAPAYTAPFWSPAPVVVTVHDISYERNPAWYPYRRDWVRRSFYRWSARRAHHVITCSWFSASEIAALYDLPADRVTVVPLGVSAAFAAPPDPHVELPVGVTRPFVLHVGDLHERRNLVVAVDAMLAARRRGGATENLTLVLVGTDRGTGGALSARATAGGAPRGVVGLGRVNEDVLRALYRCAAALVYPSRYEGFGLPVIEAMASGTPVIAARAASIPELAGDAAILLDPDDTPAWSEAVRQVLEDPELRTDLARRGAERAARFTWTRTARATMDVYLKAARRS